jgi:hypothetical protein
LYCANVKECNKDLQKGEVKMETGFNIKFEMKDRKSSDSDSNQMEGLEEKPYNCTPPSSGNEENNNGFYAGKVHFPNHYICQMCIYYPLNKF